MASVVNARLVSFATPTGQWDQPTHYALHSATTGWDPFATDVLATQPSRPQADDTVEIAAAAMVITISPGNGFPESLLRVLLRAFAMDVDYVSLHTASPTASNEVRGGGYARARLGTVG